MPSTWPDVFTFDYWVWPRPGVPVPVPVEELRPRAEYVHITLTAVHDIRFCEKLFDEWMTELDKCVAISESLFSASCPIY
jgi:hypothetical protein